MRVDDGADVGLEATVGKCEGEPAPVPTPVPDRAGLPDADEEGAEEVMTAAAGTRTRSADENDSGWDLVKVSLTYSVSLRGDKSEGRVLR